MSRETLTLPDERWYAGITLPRFPRRAVALNGGSGVLGGVIRGRDGLMIAATCLLTYVRRFGPLPKIPRKGLNAACFGLIRPIVFGAESPMAHDVCFTVSKIDV